MAPHDENQDDGFNDDRLASRFNPRLWKKLFSYARVYRRELWILAFSAACTAGTEVCYPLITRAVVDRVATDGVSAALWPLMLAYAACTLVLTLSVGTFVRMGGRIRTSVSHDLHVLRDPTRGGLATTLNEIAHQSQLSIWLDETKIPLKPAVKAACEMLGFDPLYIANEGKVIVILPANEAESALSAMRNSPYGLDAVKIGEVRSGSAGRVLLRTPIGGTRILDVLAGEMLPRIC